MAQFIRVIDHSEIRALCKAASASEILSPVERAQPACQRQQ
jgi:hypothetical protein